MSRKIAVLPGDGIGPEVTAEAVKVLQASGAAFTFESALVGGAAYDDGGHPLPKSTLDLCRSADAIIFGAVGGPKYDSIPDPKLRPEIGALLALRRELNLYANVRPAKTLRALVKASPLKGVRSNIDQVAASTLENLASAGTAERRRLIPASITVTRSSASRRGRSPSPD